MEPHPLIRLHPADNVRIARVDIVAGARLDEIGATTRGNIRAGHKVAAQLIRVGDPIRKYNAVIGHAAHDIAPGEWLHDHNISSGRGGEDYAYASEARRLLAVSDSAREYFLGYPHASGRVGTRNYVGILASVNCSATVVHKAAEWFTPERLAEFENVDGVVAFAHTTGCGMENGEPLALLRRTIGGYVRHPNIGAAVVVGLGCERNQIGALMTDQGLRDVGAVRSLIIQDEGGTRRAIEAAISAVKEVLPVANERRRQKFPASELVLGMQCGASDGFSSISANPALGVASDLLVRQGGTSILSETPEIYGVEYMLTRRAVSRTVGEKLVARIRWWEEYARGRDVQLNGNVTPGNMAGGLTNIVEKSLGSLMKGGNAPLEAVYQYAETVVQRGLVFMDSPGYDPVSATGQVAGGANVICFTTGRGSTFGCKPVPSIKIATNSPMFHRLEEDMDLNAGQILDGNKDVEQMGAEIFAAILDHASGRPTKSEALDLGRHEFVPWQIGIMG